MNEHYKYYKFAGEIVKQLTKSGLDLDEQILVANIVVEMQRGAVYINTLKKLGIIGLDNQNMEAFSLKAKQDLGELKDNTFQEEPYSNIFSKEDEDGDEEDE